MRTNSASHSGIPHEQHKIATLALTSRRFGWLSYQRSGPPNRCGDGGASAGSGGPYQSEASSWGTTSSASGVPLILTATSDLKIAVELSNTSSVSESTKRLCSIAHAAHEPSTTFGVSVLFAGVSGRHVVVGVRHSMPATAGNQDPVHRHR